MTRNNYKFLDFFKKLFFISLIFSITIFVSCTHNSTKTQKSSFNIFFNKWLDFQELINTTTDSNTISNFEKELQETFNNFYNSDNYKNYKSIYSDEEDNHFYNTIEDIKIAIEQKEYDRVNTNILRLINLERKTYNKTSLYYYLLILILLFILILIFTLLYITMNKYERELENTEELNIYSTFLIEGIESERKRISKDLHDTVLQEIKYVTLECDLIKGLDDNDRNHKENILKTSNHNIKAIRQICNNLTPPELADNLNPIKKLYNSSEKSSGLVTALTNLTNEFTTRTKIPCLMKIQDNFNTKGLSINTINNIFRICQEGFNNIEKHAQANQASLMLLMSQSEKSIIIYIKDDGKGYEKGKTDKNSPHFGIRNIYERAKMIHGTVEIETELGEGTEIRLEVPLQIGQNHSRG